MGNGTESGIGVEGDTEGWPGWARVINIFEQYQR